MSQSGDRARLDAIRKRFIEASTDWSMVVRDGTEFLYARAIPIDAPSAVAQLDRHCGYVDRDFLLSAHADIEFLLQMVERAIRTVRALNRREEHEQRTKDFSAEAAMKCGDAEFQAFVGELRKLEQPASSDEAADFIRSHCRITSRSELNSNALAADSWRQLRDQFDAWRRSRA